MEVEERLTLEQKRCETVIKTRVAVLEEKYLKSKKKEEELNKKIKESGIQKESNEKEIRMLREKSKETLAEQAKIQAQWATKLKAVEEEIKSQLFSERVKCEDKLGQAKSGFEQELKLKHEQVNDFKRQLENAQDDKNKLEERVKRENLILVRQLNELKEQSESEIREKNENILRLNNLMNEHLEKASSSTEVSSLSEQIERRDREIAIKNKELQDVTIILCKRDKEIQCLKKEIEALTSKGQSQGAEEEIARMKQHIKALEFEFK